MKADIVRCVKDWEKEFLKENIKLYVNSRIEFLRKREKFVSKKLEEFKNGTSCEESSVS